MTPHSGPRESFPGDPIPWFVGATMDNPQYSIASVTTRSGDPVRQLVRAVPSPKEEILHATI
jgi:hypothetical protein